MILVVLVRDVLGFWIGGRILLGVCLRFARIVGHCVVDYSLSLFVSVGLGFGESLVICT